MLSTAALRKSLVLCLNPPADVDCSSAFALSAVSVGVSSVGDFLSTPLVDSAVDVLLVGGVPPLTANSLLLGASCCVEERVSPLTANSLLTGVSLGGIAAGTLGEEFSPLIANSLLLGVSSTVEVGAGAAVGSVSFC